ncbi:MAG: hypothetical protein JST59_22320 [Actinobacteria bacterium]|nr:hypothetical protein [Actinomycetota bacterium]
MNMAKPYDLTILVHDYDPMAVRERREQLEQALPEAVILPFNRRERLLAAIAEMDPVPDLGPWPLALIDLQGEESEARGEHLLATINENPDLKDRVALIAFTRYGFENRDDALRAMGTRAVLSPLNLEKQEGLSSELELLARGSRNFAHLGEPPSSRHDEEVVRQLGRLFPELQDKRLDEREGWERAREILHVCRLDFEGYDDVAIQAAAGLSRRQFDKLRDQLTANPAARAANIVSAGGKKPNLGKVIEFLRPHLDETPLIWDVTVERDRLSGTGRIEWVRDRVADRYPPGEELDKRDDAWIPPLYLRALRRFLAIYDSLPKKSPSPRKGRYDPVKEALAQLAVEMEMTRDQAKHYVTHAVLCLEDAEYERSELDPA